MRGERRTAGRRGALELERLTAHRRDGELVAELRDALEVEEITASRLGVARRALPEAEGMARERPDREVLAAEVRRWAGRIAAAEARLAEVRERRLRLEAALDRAAIARVHRERRKRAGGRGEGPAGAARAGPLQLLARAVALCWRRLNSGRGRGSRPAARVGPGVESWTQSTSESWERCRTRVGHGRRR